MGIAKEYYLVLIFNGLIKLKNNLKCHYVYIVPYLMFHFKAPLIRQTDLYFPVAKKLVADLSILRIFKII